MGIALEPDVLHGFVRVLERVAHLLALLDAHGRVARAVQQEDRAPMLSACLAGEVAESFPESS